jgi:hypothetical protein
MAVDGDSVICQVNCFCKRIQSESERDVFADLDSDTFTVSTRAETAGKNVGPTTSVHGCDPVAC